VTLLKMLKAFSCLLALVVLSVLYVGLLFSAGLSIIAGFLRTFGMEQIKMGLWYGVDLPVMFSIPFSLLIALLLFFCATYIKRSIVFCLSNLRI